MNILIIDNDPHRRALHAFGLGCAGFEAYQSSTGMAHIEMIRHAPGLVILFAEQLDDSTQTLTRILTAGPLTPLPPVVAALARLTTSDLILAFELGLRECLLLPLAPQTLISRVQTWLNMHKSASVLDCGLTVDVENGTLSRLGKTLTLGPTERRTLAALLEFPEWVLTREQLLSRVHNTKDADPKRLIDVSICRLRGSLRKLGCAELLQTVRGRGYRFVLRQPKSRSCEESHVATFTSDTSASIDVRG